MIKDLKLIGEMVALEVVAETREVPKLDLQTGEDTGETRTEYLVPKFGRVAHFGTDVNEFDIDFKIGDKVQLPSGNMIQLLDPRIASGELEEDSDEVTNYVATHYKNIVAVYP